MKKLILLFLMSLFVISCEDKDLYQGIPKDQVYEQSFQKTFGKIARTQTWGFTKMITRSAYPNGNMWDRVPNAITPEERDAVLEIFSQKGDASYESLIDWNKFFVQKVYKGDSIYVADNGGRVKGSDHINWIFTLANKKVNVISWWPYEEELVTVEPYQDHIFNFNSSGPDNYNGSMLMINSNTNVFGYHESTSGKTYTYFRMEQINGNYYVGFDYSAEGNNPNQRVQRDYVYDDYIVKIIPGEGIKEEGRIICEDMGTIGDFDFNDVVFDAVIYNDGTTEITLLAAGGTLDISVDGVNVGEVMGKMVNTGLTKVNIYHFESANKYNNLIEIPIVVRDTVAGEVTSYELSAEVGKAPQKIKVPRTFRWCKEYESIKDAYPGFSNWVTEGNFWSGQVVESLIYE